MKTWAALLIIVPCLASPSALAEEEHDHAKKEEHHAEHEAENSGVGPDKGILEKGEKGFRLAPEAVSSFGLKTEKLSGKVPASAVVKVKEARFAYRLKDGWIQRVALADAKPGDELITGGTGFVRIAELVVEEGLEDHHD